ncbi:MAG: hypothetical protein ABSA53_28965 [Streptosporangiaceae bacterium]
MTELAAPACGPAPGADLAPALAGLASALVDVETLSGALEAPPRIALTLAAPAAAAAAATLIERLAAALGLSEWRVVAGQDGLTAAELAIGNHLSRTALLGGPVRVENVSDGLIAAAVRQARRHQPAMITATARDGSTLRCYAAGPADGPVVAIVSACGMPVGLLRRWIAGLGDRFRVLTWESRGLFGPPAMLEEDFDRRGYDVPAQAADLSAMLDAFNVDAAHVIALCGGAALALAADATRVRSLSLWHGDYELGPGIPKTSHRQDVRP